MGIGDVVTSFINRGTSQNNTGMIINKFDHYSASQIGVWFGNIYLDDISSIQWTRQQSKKPLYGYASQTFDAVAKGTVLISGSFIVNFRQSGYLSAVMRNIQMIYGRLNDKSRWDTVRSVIQGHLRNGTFGPSSVGNTGVETLQQIVDIGNSPDFMSLAKAYEDVIWGNGVPGDIDGGLQSNGVNDPPDVEQHNGLPNGFNILVTYGNNSNNQPISMNDYVQSTTKAINGVHLLGESQVIQVGGQPVQEQYDFIARNTDEFIGNKS
jgi:hypothetical protein